MGIRVVPQEGIPAIVHQHLQPDEVQVITVLRHPAVLAPTALSTVAVVAVFALRATDVIHGSTRAFVILGVLLALCCFLLCLNVVAWLRAYVVVTSRRLLIVSWWRNHHVTAIPISSLDQMTFVRTVPGRLLGYGTVRFKRPRTRRRVLKIRFLPYPEQLYLEMAGLIFRDREHD